MEDIIIAVILVAIIGFAAWYVYKSKKAGKKCIGCPDGTCNCSASKGEGSCNCGCGGNCSGSN